MDLLILAFLATIANNTSKNTSNISTIKQKYGFRTYWHLLIGPAILIAGLIILDIFACMHK